ncbi:MAG: hypothetical protein JNK82_09375 [Myxococcaceae bacterium]|nr:hypothetical protein [Myxococcaceae bacterium]
MLSLLLGALIGAAPSDAGPTGEPPSLSAVMPELKVISSTEPEFVKHWGRAMTELMAALERTDHARALALVDGLYEEVGRLRAEAPVQTQMGWRPEVAAALEQPLPVHLTICTGPLVVS